MDLTRAMAVSGRSVLLAAVVALGLLGRGAGADDAQVSRRAAMAGWRAVSAAELDGLRGGFQDPGLSIAIGVQRIAWVDGQEVSKTVLQLPAGAGPGMMTTTGPAVLQNQISGLKIQTSTTIQATVDGMSALRALNLQTAVRDAVVGSLPR